MLLTNAGHEFASTERAWACELAVDDATSSREDFRLGSAGAWAGAGAGSPVGPGIRSGSLLLLATW